MAKFDLQTLLVVLLPLSVVIYWIIDLEKDITNFISKPSRDTFNPILTKLSAFIGAFVVFNLYAHSKIDLGGDKGTAAREFLSGLAWSDLMLLALVVASGAGAGADYLRARNSADPTVKAKVLPPAEPAVPAPVITNP